MIDFEYFIKITFYLHFLDKFSITSVSNMIKAAYGEIPCECGHKTKTGPHVRGCLPLASRLILYGLCGFFAEVMFTATWYFVDSAKYRHGWKLHGCTSVWSFPIYAVSCYVVERMYLFLNDKTTLVVRGFIYVIWTYIWEFLTGLLLRQFNACPWDYTEYTHFNIMGLITLDYAPLWYFGALLLETVVIQSALQLQYATKRSANQEKIN